jgi:predicted Rossmann fold nucleotide-binding protein DprA/Smf involved in DNA uptake
MDYNESSALIQLLAVPGIGPARVRSLVGHFVPPKPCYRRRRALCQVEGIERTLAENIHQADNLAFARQQLEVAERQGCRMLTFWDAEFPAMLKKFTIRRFALCQRRVSRA